MTPLQTIDIGGVVLHLSNPVSEVPEWIGQHDVLVQLLAAWSCFSEDDLPLNARLLGKLAPEEFLRPEAR